jgi:hypothetical protein
MDPSDTGLNDQSQSPAAPADLGGQPSSAQRTGANMPQGMAPADIYANASLGPHTGTRSQRTRVTDTTGPRLQCNHLPTFTQQCLV